MQPEAAASRSIFPDSAAAWLLLFRETCKGGPERLPHLFRIIQKRHSAKGLPSGSRKRLIPHEPAFRPYPSSLSAASCTYNTCGYSGEAESTFGWLNSAAFLMPARRITAWEGRFTQAVNE